MHTKTWAGYITASYHVYLPDKPAGRVYREKKLLVRAEVTQSYSGTNGTKKAAVLEAVDILESLKDYKTLGFDPRGVLHNEWKVLVDKVGKYEWPYIAEIEIEPADELLKSVGLDMGSYYSYAASKYDLPVEAFYKDTEYENL